MKRSAGVETNAMQKQASWDLLRISCYKWLLLLHYITTTQYALQAVQFRYEITFMGFQLRLETIFSASRMINCYVLLQRF